MSFRALAMLGGVVLLAIHFYRLYARVSGRRDGHQEIEKPSEAPPVESIPRRPRVRALSSPAIDVAADEGSR